jgi:hypothetical protein
MLGNAVFCIKKNLRSENNVVVNESKPFSISQNAFSKEFINSFTKAILKTEKLFVKREEGSKKRDRGEALPAFPCFLLVPSKGLHY